MEEQQQDDLLVPAGNDSDDEELQDAFSISNSDDDENRSIESVDEEMGANESRRSPEGNDNVRDISVAKSGAVTFDRKLPASHAYLGIDLEELAAGQTILDSNTIVENVALLPVPNLVLMPNQSLPLQSLHPRLIAMFRTIIAHSKVFGVVLSSQNDDHQELADMGTLAQVLAYKEETEHEITTLKIRAVGRQRFTIVETRRQIDGVLMAKVRVLPDIVTGDPLKCAQTTTTGRFKRLKMNNKMGSKYFCSCFTPLPPFVYQQYDVVNIINLVIEELKQWYETDRINELSSDATDFSYWVASMMPIEDNLKLYLLGINCAVQRLRCELSLLRRCTLLRCRTCKAVIGKKSSVFSMSVMGPMNAYVNPYGHVMETLTLNDVERNCMTSIGRPTTENTWFPGYAWTIIQCATCRSHKGWHFVAVKKHLKPSHFWGITRTSIMPTLDETNNDPEDDKWVPTM